MPAPLKEKAARLALIAEVSDRMYEETNSFEFGTLGADLAYLYAAIAKGTCVQWTDDTKRGETLKLLRETFPPDHAVWKSIEIEADENPPLPMVRESATSRTLVCPKCGSESFQCSGEAHCSQVSVDAHLHRDGSVDASYDWMDAGSADFEPGEVSCGDCGQAVTEPVEGEVGVYEDAEDLTCAECGHPMVVNGDGTTNHLVEGSSGTDEIDHDQDEDHAALAPEEDETIIFFSEGQVEDNMRDYSLKELDSAIGAARAALADLERLLS